MLKLSNITKDYKVASDYVHALKGVSLVFRKNEFVSVLGPSGCGKTTLLNIIGGLDHYTEGDLVIQGKSTKNFSDHDWDVYRNHRIGFIFQSYNLIPHQTVLGNVELALTIAGVKREERRARAKEALERVGLGRELYKRPNQLSGGQMQRVAIARALVNNPDILLADEPTGALDSETSLQIMELIKEIASERLVIMVTHNPELAEQYSTRIVRLKDGLVESDSNPFTPEEEEEELRQEAERERLQEEAEAAKAAATPKKKGKKNKSKLTLGSVFRLSARNLLSKLKRTLLVCLAGSIGIIGVSTVLSVSTGVTNYIDNMQNEMLSGNPVRISETAMNLSGLMESQDRATQANAFKFSVQNGKINVDYMIEYLARQTDQIESLMVENEITEDYIEFVKAMPEEYYAEMGFDYGVNMSNNIYTQYNFVGQEGDKMSLTGAQAIYTSLLGETVFKDYTSMASMVMINYEEAPSSTDFISSQFDILNPGGKIATEMDEIMLVVNKDTELTDLLLAQLGYYTQDEFLNIAYRASGNKQYKPSLDKHRFTYEELLGKAFMWYPNDVVYRETGVPIMPFAYNAKAEEGWENGVELKITAILRPKEDVSYASMNSGIYYTPKLTQHILQDSLRSKIVKFLIDNEKAYYSNANYATGGPTLPMYTYSFTIDGEKKENLTAFVGRELLLASMMGDMIGSMGGGNVSIDPSAFKTLSVRDLGGESLPSAISLYATDFDIKDLITGYLDTWNGNEDITVGDKVIKAEDRDNIYYTDNLKIIIGLVNTFIQMITAALVAFTSLSLVVSTVMIAIITYVSVIERIKEIGVIRSLGGRKGDVSSLFMAETFILGAISGIIGVGVTYLLSGLINLIVGSIAGIYTIATLTIPTALIMISVSILLTLISGLIPARLAAKKDPVIALRTE